MKIIKRIVFAVLLLVVLALAYPAYLIIGGKIVIGNFSMLMSAVRGQGIATPAETIVRQRLQVPSGYGVATWVANLPGVRMLRMTAAGDLLVSRPRSGEVVLILSDRNGDGQPDGQRVLLSGLKRPHGIDFYQDWLYIAESDAVGRVRLDAMNGKIIGDYQRLLTGLGDGGAHWTKSLRIADDGWVYLASGSTCNVCVENDKHRAAISRMRVDGSDYQVFASGLRNSVGLDISPEDNQLYATDNGRDLLGDDIPPCEMNRIVKDGFYGFPYRYGNNVPDPEYGEEGGKQADNALPPFHAFRAHNAPLGLHFLRKAIPGFGENTPLIALHGSWNRSKPDGYKVVALLQNPDGVQIEVPFLSGFEKDGNVIGRPVDVVQDSDGAIYVSDDYAGAIYRIAPLSSGQSKPAIAMTQSVSRGSVPAPLVTEAMLLQGQQVWERYGCAQCHGARPGDKALKVLAGLGSRYDQASLAEFFMAPTPPMPRFPLTDNERQAVAAWLLQSR